MNSSPEHLDVLIVGAGLSGIGAARYLQAQCPWASYAIFEARDAIGGTWDLFRYPGVRSDSDMFTLGYSFRPWRRAQVDRRRRRRSCTYITTRRPRPESIGRIRFNHRVVRASTGQPARPAGASSRDAPTPARRWSSRAASSSAAPATTATTAATSPTSPAWTASAALIVHPQSWPEDLDYAGQRVIVIGSGATAVTLVPALAETAGHVTMLQRSPSYIASLPAKDPIADAARPVCRPGMAGPVIRWFKALTTQAFFQLSRRRPELVKRILRHQIVRASCRPDTTSTPTSPPGTTPGTSGSASCPTATCSRRSGTAAASVVTDHIDTFTETGLRLESGAELDADIIVTATGLELLFIGGIEPVGRRGARRPRQQSGLQGHDARGRAQPRRSLRVHERLLDPQVRPDL